MKEQPRDPKRFKRVTKRQRRIVRARLKYPSRTQKEIADKLGIGQPEVCETLHKPHVVAKMNDIMDAAGLTDDFIAKKVKSLAGAKKKVFFSAFGKVVDEREIEDAAIQLAATNLAANIKGHNQKKLDVTSNGHTVKALLLEDD